MSDDRKITLEDIERQLGMSLPTSYSALLQAARAQTKKSFLLFYALDRVMSLNEKYQVGKFAPGAFVVGSDGGGEALVLDVRPDSPTNGQFYFMPFIPLGWKEAVLAGTTLEEIMNSYNARWG